jgi:hypothetical protein
MGNIFASNAGPNRVNASKNTGPINVVVKNNSSPNNVKGNNVKGNNLKGNNVGAAAPKANTESIDVDLDNAEEGEVSDLSLAERGSSPSPPITAGGARKSRKNRKSSRKNRKNSRRTSRNRN